MTTYVLLGPKIEKTANCLTTKKQYKTHLVLNERAEGRKYEIKKEFKAPSWEVARIVYEVYNGWIEDVNTFLNDLTKFYGYKLEKSNVSIEVGRSKRRNA